VIYGFFLRRFYNAVTKPYDFQSAVGRKVIELYEKQGHVSALVCGKPGIGKSSLVYVVKDMLKAAGKAPTVVTGFRLTTIGMSLSTLTGFGAARDTPLIGDITEFDGAINFAESAEMKEKECLAKDKAALKSTLETLMHMPYTIAILSGNTPLTSLDTCYTHSGAVDFTYQA
jgi:hypothetical protein